MFIYVCICVLDAAGDLSEDVFFPVSLFWFVSLVKLKQKLIKMSCSVFSWKVQPLLCVFVHLSVLVSVTKYL